MTVRFKGSDDVHPRGRLSHVTPPIATVPLASSTHPSVASRFPLGAPTLHAASGLTHNGARGVRSVGALRQRGIRA